VDIKIEVAIIAAAVSLLVSLISLITAIITNRASSSTAHNLELIRQEFARASKSSDIADGELAATLDALKEGLQVIQNMKNEIQLILAARESSLTSDEAIARIAAAREVLFEAYKSGHADIAEAESSPYHRTKNMALQVERTLATDLESKKYASDLSPSARSILIDLRTQLTDAQHALRDCKTDKLIRRTLER